MIDISVNDLNKYYGSNHVLKGITFEINSGEKIGLLGRNGSGKTTLFKTITGEEYYESGSIAKASGKRVEMLAQIPVFEEEETVEDVLCSSFREVFEIQKAMKKIEGDENPDVLARYGKFMEEYERLGGYETEVKTEKICNGMKIDGDMRKSVFSLLSGGEKTRVNLARILLRDCDILLLDEPTNHLDLASLEWLEEFLHDFSGTIIVISHDRIFLDRVVTRIIEINEGKANFYSGNYTFYVEERERRYLTQSEQYKQQQRKIGQLQDAIKRQRVWAQINPSNTGLAKRALAMEKRIDQMDKIEKPVMAKKLMAEFDTGGHAAKEIVAFDSVHKQYGKKVILDQRNLSLFRNDSIALIGENGCGKSTLLKLITGEETCDSGNVKVSSNVKIAYMPQMIRFDEEKETVLNTLRNAFGLTEEKARSILAGFRFRATDVIKKVCNLSGGEKSRLKLCLLMQDQVNFLILDEPTNHLDIESREWIENALSEFEGTLLFVSHDRYFLNKFADKVWSMKNGVITRFDCGFEEFKETQSKNAILEEEPKKNNAKLKKSPKTKTINDEKSPAPSIEALIIEGEAELNTIRAEIELDLVKGDFSRMNELYGKKNQLENQINFWYNEWVKGGI